MKTRPLFVHIGSSKTGTSSLQRGLWESVAGLARAGVGLPFVGRADHLDSLVRPMGWVAGSGFVNAVRRKPVSALSRRLRNTSGDRLLISNEDLCEFGVRHIGLLGEVAAEADLEIHLVITARDWSIQLPSEWQQFLKHRLTTDYPTFLDEVRDRQGPTARHFWRRQDVVGICDRWARRLPPERVNVISVPSAKVDPEGIFRMFGEVVGFEGSSLKRTPAGANASFGYVEAEVYRRLNETLGPRLAHYENEYYPAVRIPLVSGVLPRQASPRITLPPEHLPWVREVGRGRLEILESRGYRLHGDVEGLVAPADAASPLPPLEEAEVTAAAFETLAAFAVRAFRSTR